MAGVLGQGLSRWTHVPPHSPLARGPPHLSEACPAPRGGLGCCPADPSSSLTPSTTGVTRPRLVPTPRPCALVGVPTINRWQTSPWHLFLGEPRQTNAAGFIYRENGGGGREGKREQLHCDPPLGRHPHATRKRPLQPPAVSVLRDFRTIFSVGCTYLNLKT